MKNSGSSGRREMVEGEDINYYDVNVEVEWGIVLTELNMGRREKKEERCGYYLFVIIIHTS